MISVTTWQINSNQILQNLVAGYLKELSTAAKLDLNLGLVQTAYANGSSTKYIKEKLVRKFK